MGDNEDYLDSLLKQASVIDNPDSALSRVKDLTQREKEEREAVETSAEVENKDNEMVTDKDDSLSVFDELLSENESAVINTEIDNVEDLISFSLGSENSANDEENASDISLDDNMAKILELAESDERNDLEDNTDLISDTNLTTENAIDSLESVISDDLDLLDIPADLHNETENTDTIDLDFNDEIINTDDLIDTTVQSDSDSVLSDIGDLLEDSSTSEIEDLLIDLDAGDSNSADSERVDDVVDLSAETETEMDDIEKLLSSGFSGEIEVPENIEEATAAEKSNDASSTPAENADNENSVMSAEDIDKLINSMNSTEDIPEIDGFDGADFSESDIDDLIDKAKETETPDIKEELEIDLSDLEAFENEFGIHDKNEVVMPDESNAEDDSMNLSDIMGDSSIDSEDADIMSLLSDAVSQSEEEEAKEEAESLQDKDSKKKKKKKEKKAKDKAKETEEEPKKKGKIARFFEFLTKEDEPEEQLIDAKDASSTDGLENGENKEILDELDSEGEEKGKKKKKKKKDKGKKGKDSKKESDDDLDDDSDEDGGKDKKKVKKPKKEKKERKPLALDIDTGKPLSKKNVILIFVLCLSIMGAIILIVNIIPPMIQGKEARDAFYKGDFEKTYQTFLGEELDESDQILFESSEIILKLQHKYDAYKAYLNMKMRTEALDQLLQAVSKYDIWYIVAESHNVSKQFNSVYENIIKALESEFGLTLTDAKEIIAIPDDLEYSLKCYSIAYKTECIDPNNMPSEFVPPVEDEPLEDELSEEGN